MVDLLYGTRNCNARGGGIFCTHTGIKGSAMREARPSRSRALHFQLSVSQV
jgi:hypothetical protein